MFGAQEAGARHGHVHPEHTEEQQAADGPRGEHGLSWLREVALGGRGFQVACLSPRCASELLGKEPSGQVRGLEDLSGDCEVGRVSLPQAGEN